MFYSIHTWMARLLTTIMRKLPTVIWYLFGTATFVGFVVLTLKKNTLLLYVIIHEYITLVHYNDGLIGFIYPFVRQWGNWGFPRAFLMFHHKLKTILKSEPQVFFSGFLLKRISLQCITPWKLFMINQLFVRYI